MSFLGVGAPEAILVAVVALVVFGPKGLAEAAKSLGRTLRAFQPTIREVVEVSQDLKGTLEKELGLDELRTATRPLPKPRVEGSMDSGSNFPPLQPVTEDVAKSIDPDIEAKRALSAQAAWGATAPTASAAPVADKNMAALTVEELELELARRKAAATASKPQEVQSNQTPNA